MQRRHRPYEWFSVGCLVYLITHLDVTDQHSLDAKKYGLGEDSVNSEKGVVDSIYSVCDVETSYFTQLKICYLMTTFRCLSDILITSWLFIAWWSTWPGNHLVPCVAELVGSCIPIHARRCLPDPKCLFYPSGLSLCFSVDHVCLVPVDDMVLFHGMVCDGWLMSYSALPCRERVHFFVVFLDP